MKEIQDKIKELIALGECEDYDKFNEHMAKQENLFTELKVLAKKNKTLLGRVIGLGVADGEAKYVVTKVNKNSVSTQFIYYCDGYSDWSLGRGKGTMPIHKAEAFIKFEDIFDK
jgi:hypothetical protein